MKHDVDSFRRWHLAVAEFIDAWRLMPRLLVVGYGWMVWKVVQWYMLLPEPSTQHAALVTTVVGISAAVLGLYTGTGRKWDSAFIPWKKNQEKE